MERKASRNLQNIFYITIRSHRKVINSTIGHIVELVGWNLKLSNWINTTIEVPRTTELSLVVFFISIW